MPERSSTLIAHAFLELLQSQLLGSTLVRSSSSIVRKDNWPVSGCFKNRTRSGGSGCVSSIALHVDPKEICCVWALDIVLMILADEKDLVLLDG